MNRIEYRHSASGLVKSWVGRAVLAVVGIVIAVGAFFFLTIALIAGAILAAAIALRFWWVMRRVRKTVAASGPLEGEYTVVPNRQIPRQTVER